MYDVEDFPVATIGGQTAFEFRQSERGIREACMVCGQKSPNFVRRQFQVKQRRVQVEEQKPFHSPQEPRFAPGHVDEKYLHRIRRFSPVQDVPRVQCLMEEAVPMHFCDFGCDQHAVTPPHRLIVAKEAARHEVGPVARILDEPRDDEGIFELPVVFARFAERQDLSRRNIHPADSQIIAPFAAGMRQMQDVSVGGFPLAVFVCHGAVSGRKLNLPDLFPAAVRQEIPLVSRFRVRLNPRQILLETFGAPVGRIKETQRQTPRGKRIGKNVHA